MGHCDCHTNWDCGERKIGLPPMVRGYWFTDCGQRVGAYLDAGPYRLTNKLRKIEGVEAREVVRDVSGGHAYWVPSEVIDRVCKLQGIA